MKVVICSLNSKYIHSSLAPWCLLAGVREFASKETQEEVNITVIEGTINEPIENVFNRIKAAAPSVVAFSCYIWNINRVYELAGLLKEDNPATLPVDLKIVFGGPEVSYNTEEIFKNNEHVDYIISGEGEEPFARLCDYLVKPTSSVKESDSSVEVNSKEIYSNRQELLKNYSIATRENPQVLPFTPEYIPPSPYSDEYFAALNGKIAYLETSRGCPFRCAFCLSGRCGGVRQYPIERAKEELIKLANSGTKTIKLVDRTFNYDISRAKKLWGFIIENYGITIPKDICFHFEIGGDLLDDECIEILKSAPSGLIQFEIGLQSFNEKTLEAINRKTNTDKLCENIRRLIDPNNIHVHIDLIAGLPFEDYESFKEGFNKAYELRPHMLQLGFLKLLYGADMRENAEHFPCEYAQNAPYEVKSTPWLDAQSLARLHAVEDVLDRVANSGRFNRSATFAREVLNLDGYDTFSFFELFADYLTGKDLYGITLDKYTELFYEFYKSKMSEENGKIFRDLLVEDRLTTNASGKLPKCLQVKDEKLRKVRIKLGFKRAVAILYTKSQVICVDYSNRNSVTGEYSAKYFDLHDLLEEND